MVGTTIIEGSTCPWRILLIIIQETVNCDSSEISSRAFRLSPKLLNVVCRANLLDTDKKEEE